jgi:hypothetical protein
MARAVTIELRDNEIFIFGAYENSGFPDAQFVNFSRGMRMTHLAKLTVTK